MNHTDDKLTHTLPIFSHNNTSLYENKDTTSYNNFITIFLSSSALLLLFKLYYIGANFSWGFPCFPFDAKGCCGFPYSHHLLRFGSSLCIDDWTSITDASGEILTSLGIERKTRESPTNICKDIVRFEQ